MKNWEKFFLVKEESFEDGEYDITISTQCDITYKEFVEYFPEAIKKFQELTTNKDFQEVLETNFNIDVQRKIPTVSLEYVGLFNDRALVLKVINLTEQAKKLGYKLVKE